MSAGRSEDARHVSGLPFVTVDQCKGQKQVAPMNQVQHQEVGRFERDGDVLLRRRHDFEIPNGLGRDPRS